MASKKAASPSGGADPGVAHVPAGGGVAGSEEHPAVRRTPSGGCSPARYRQVRDDWLPRQVELTVRAHGRSPTSSFLLCSLFSDPLGLRSQTCLDFPRSKAAVSPYRAATVCCLQLSRSDRRTSCFGYVTADSTLNRASRSTWWASILSDDDDDDDALTSAQFP